MTDNTQIIEDDSAETAAAAAPAETTAAPAPKATKPKAAAAPKAAATPKAVEPRVRIILEENDNIPPTGLFIGINGRSFLIRPGEEVDVPSDVLEVLNDAVEATPKTDLQGNVVDYRNKMRFPYRIVAK